MIRASLDGITSDLVALEVVATSSSPPDSVPTVVGRGQMTFKKGEYEFKTKPVSNPGTVTVDSDLGGTTTVNIRVRYGLVGAPPGDPLGVGGAVKASGQGVSPPPAPMTSRACRRCHHFPTRQRTTRPASVNPTVG